MAEELAADKNQKAKCSLPRHARKNMSNIEREIHPMKFQLTSLEKK
ncbi:MAG: hypothetical protein LUE87_00480 [Lachnospiraceae bacterium]|nr:hypothetical protein [Lachnospiraceae bacterium]